MLTILNLLTLLVDIFSSLIVHSLKQWSDPCNKAFVLPVKELDDRVSLSVHVHDEIDLQLGRQLIHKLREVLRLLSIVILDVP